MLMLTMIGLMTMTSCQRYDSGAPKERSGSESVSGQRPNPEAVLPEPSRVPDAERYQPMPLPNRDKPSSKSKDEADQETSTQKVQKKIARL